MSATILPFARPAPATRSVTQIERAKAAGWAAHQAASWGGSWWVEAHLGEDGEVWLGLVTPSSRGRALADRTLAWMISRCSEGVALMIMPSGKTVGVFHTVSQALAAVERTEKAPSGVAYGP